MKRWLVLSVSVVVLVLSGVLSAGAQMYLGGPLEVWKESDEAGNQKLNVRQHERGAYTLILDFYDVENVQLPEMASAYVIRDASVMTIRPVIEGEPWDYNVNSKWVPGRINPGGVDPCHAYRLPFINPAKKKVGRLSYGGKDNNVENYSGLRFEMRHGDTICAARQGVVIYVTDWHEPTITLEDGTIEANSQYNSVDIQHDDGTIARYGPLEKESIVVKSGNMVFAGMPIARAGLFENKYQFRFHLFYQTDNLREIASLDQHALTYHYINPVFATSKGETQLMPGKTYSHPAP
jgi:murein DD-endopeptidase MepM/ murein hydrolase activator NlpD